uniref:TBC1 domain family, member 22B n=1 Tax=Neogobius melanostomus TaxID=47308 RepID=A0A8C6T856_9GOBI
MLNPCDFEFINGSFCVYLFDLRIRLGQMCLFDRVAPQELTLVSSVRRYLKETKLNLNNLKTKKASSFHEFARSTNDAWDIDDEEEEDFLSAPRLTVATRSNDSELDSRSSVDCTETPSDPQDEAPSDPQTPGDESLNGTVPKSNSEDSISSSGRSCHQKQQSLPARPVIPLVARISDQNSSGAPPMTIREKSRLDKFRQLLSSPSADLDALRKHSWSGIPREVRPVTWRLLSIHIDIPRTNPLIPLFQQPAVQEVFERILFIWAIRHPASGYVQGINDLVTPFFVVFLSEFVEDDMENFDVAALPLETQRNIEADSFWCMSKLLDGIQDNYTFAQPGIQNKVKALEELIGRIDEDVHLHFCRYEVEYLQFAFRWMNNLLMRELPLRCTIRLWDTYQAESEGFSHFHLYVCAAFLIKWRKDILSIADFQGLLMLLQNLPTIHWGNEEVGLLLAEAYRLKYMFADAPSHYKR